MEINEFMIRGTITAAYSKTVLLNWINRVMFANAIKRYHNCAAIIETIDVTSTPADGNSIFEKIVDEGDYFNVFNGIEFNDMIPTETWIDIVDFNRFLIDNGISDIDQSVLQNLLEKTVSAAKREVRGQYTTPPWLADILCQITINDWAGVCADICSGTGTIAKAIITNKNRRIHDIERALGTTWVSDKYAYPLQVSNIALTNFESINIPVNLFQADVFELSPGKHIVIKNPSDGCDIHLQYPKLDAVVSNLPFVKANLIAKDEKEHIADIRKEIKDKTGIMISGKADLYIYFPFKIHQLLCDEGRLGIILSNFWLGTETGKDFFHALSYYYNFREVVLSNRGKWFDNAEVIATLVVLQKKCISQPDPSGKVNFCLTEKDLKTISVDQKENIITDIVLQEERDSKLVQIKSYSMQEIMNIQEKGISINAFFHDISWANKIADKLIPVNDIFIIKRGERRGWNALFYPCEEHGIEAVYIKEVLKAPGKLTGYKGKTDIKAFCCNKSMEELQQLGHCGAINWIRKFAAITNGTGELLPIALGKAGCYWYEMEDSTKADMVTALNPNKRLFVARFDEPTFVDQRFTCLLVKDTSVSLKLSHALLNSVYGMFAIEAIGFGRGLGVLDASSSNFKNIYMLNPHLLSIEEAEKIVQLFESIENRDVYDTEVELQDSKREVFDRFVLTSFGIEGYYEDIKHSLMSMQKTRLAVR